MSIAIQPPHLLPSCHGVRNARNQPWADVTLICFSDFLCLKMGSTLLDTKKLARLNANLSLQIWCFRGQTPRIQFNLLLSFGKAMIAVILAFFFGTSL